MINQILDEPYWENHGTLEKILREGGFNTDQAYYLMIKEKQSVANQIIYVTTTFNSILSKLAREGSDKSPVIDSTWIKEPVLSHIEEIEKILIRLINQYLPLIKDFIEQRHENILKASEITKSHDVERITLLYIEILKLYFWSIEGRSKQKP